MTRAEDEGLDKFIDKQLAKGYVHPPLNLPLRFILLFHQEERWEASTSAGLLEYQ